MEDVEKMEVDVEKMEVVMKDVFAGLRGKKVHSDDNERPTAVPTTKAKVAQKTGVSEEKVVAVKKRGRKPIGDAPLTKTEMQARWRAKKKSQQK